MKDKTWLDIIDVTLCRLATFAPAYTELVEQAHGWLQCVLAGTAELSDLLAAAVLPADDSD